MKKITSESTFDHGLIAATIIMISCILLFVFLILFSCRTSEPTIKLKEHCDEKAIKKHIESCVPAGIQGQELAHYRHECTKDAREKFCKDKRFLVIRGKEIPCDNVSKKYKNHCD